MGAWWGLDEVSSAPWLAGKSPKKRRFIAFIAGKIIVSINIDQHGDFPAELITRG